MRSVGGFQHTYCDSFQTEEEFEAMFNHDLWRCGGHVSLFGRHFLMKNYRLPRQAWDTHEETLRGKPSFLQGDASAIWRRRQIHHRGGGSEGGGRRQLIRRWWCVSNGVREDTAGDGLERVAC